MSRLGRAPVYLRSTHHKFSFATRATLFRKNDAQGKVAATTRNGHPGTQPDAVAFFEHLFVGICAKSQLDCFKLVSRNVSVKARSPHRRDLNGSVRRHPERSAPRHVFIKFIFPAGREIYGIDETGPRQSRDMLRSKQG